MIDNEQREKPPGEIIAVIAQAIFNKVNEGSIADGIGPVVGLSVCEEAAALAFFIVTDGPESLPST